MRAVQTAGPGEQDPRGWALGPSVVFLPLSESLDSRRGWPKEGEGN